MKGIWNFIFQRKKSTATSLPQPALSERTPAEAVRVKKDDISPMTSIPANPGNIPQDQIQTEEQIQNSCPSPEIPSAAALNDISKGVHDTNASDDLSKKNEEAQQSSAEKVAQSLTPEIVEKTEQVLDHASSPPSIPPKGEPPSQVIPQMSTLVSEPSTGKTDPENPALAVPAIAQDAVLSANESQRQIVRQEKQQVFVLLGSHEKNNRAVLRVLEILGLEPVDMSMHRTTSTSIEEFFRNYLAINFAIITLSADEFVYPKERKPAEAKLRSKSELIFGLGFLIGKLGKAKCLVVYAEQKSLLLPAPIFDVMYTIIEEHGFWQKILADRLQKAGYQIDEKILRKL